MKPPDVICMGKPYIDYDLKLNNFIILIKYASKHKDDYLFNRALSGYLNIIKQQIQSLN